MTWNSPFVATQLKRWDCSSASKFLEPAFHLFYLCIRFVYFDWVIPDLSFSYCKRERASESDRKVTSFFFFFKCFDPLRWRTKGAAWIKEIMIQVDMSISRWFRASQVEGRGGKDENFFFSLRFKEYLGGKKKKGGGIKGKRRKEVRGGWTTWAGSGKAEQGAETGPGGDAPGAAAELPRARSAGTCAPPG